MSLKGGNTYIQRYKNFSFPPTSKISFGGRPCRFRSLIIKRRLAVTASSSSSSSSSGFAASIRSSSTLGRAMTFLVCIKKSPLAVTAVSLEVRRRRLTASYYLKKLCFEKKSAYKGTQLGFTCTSAG